ncbi:unnamed protein product [Rotaria sp. Silwood2]|nr:unnamed protein product [Rotaria sp. Silwood2]
MVGFDVKNKNILHTSYIRFVCSLLLRDTIQLTWCGHRQCQSCFYSQHQINIKCQQYLTETSKSQVHLDQSTKCKYCHEQLDSVENLNEHKITKCEKMFIHHCNLSNPYWSEQHLNSLLETFHQMELQLENVRKSSTQMDMYSSQSITVVAIDANTVRFQESCEILHIPSRNLNILNSDEQERFNNKLLQCQAKSLTLKLSFLQSKLSIQLSNIATQMNHQST